MMGVLDRLFVALRYLELPSFGAIPQPHGVLDLAENQGLYLCRPWPSQRTGSFRWLGTKMGGRCGELACPISRSIYLQQKERWMGGANRLARMSAHARRPLVSD
jgi:hypothetical protein